MSSALSDNPFDGLLAAVNRPTAPHSSRAVAEPAAEACSLPASAAFSSFAEASEDKFSCPAKLAIELSPVVALILSLVTSAKGISADEAISRGICVFAQTIGIPSLARQNGEDEGARHANSESADLHAVPRFERRAPSRFKKG